MPSARNVAADSILTKLYPLTFVQQWGPAIEGPDE